MALTQNKVAFLQTPRTATAVLTTASTDLDDSPTTAVHLLTAGSNGSRLVGLTAIPRDTVTATRVDVWLSKDGGATLHLIGDFVVAAHTVANATAIPVSSSGLSMRNVAELEADDRLYVSASVSLAAGIVVFAKFIDYGGPVPYPSRYVANSGSDSNDGLTGATAWQTLGKVNATTLAPGSTIAFNGGDVFAGYLDLSDRAGASGAPITFTSYGTGRATINSGNGIAVYGKDIQHIVIDGINLVGSGVGMNLNHGLMVYNTSGSSNKKQYIRIRNMEIRGFNRNGVVIGSEPGDGSASGYNDVIIENVYAHDNGEVGILSYGYTVGTAHTNISVLNCRVINNEHHGVVLSACGSSLIEGCVADGNGAVYTGGTAAFMIYDATTTMIRGCEAYGQMTPNAGGGNGFNIDQNCTNCVLEYSYAHNNEGAGIELYGAASGTWANNTVRYCVSENNGANVPFNGALTYATAGGAMTGARVYNNVFHMGIAGRGCVRILNNNLQGDFINNIFYAASGADLIKTQTEAEGPLTPHAGLLFRGNNYYPTGAFAIRWGGSNYASRSAWRAAYTSQETISGSDVSVSVNPRLASPGGGGMINAIAANLTAYRLLSSSPMIGVGLDITALLGIDEGGRDFYGVGVPHASGSGFNIGADGAGEGAPEPPGVFDFNRAYVPVLAL